MLKSTNKMLKNDKLLLDVNLALRNKFQTIFFILLQIFQQLQSVLHQYIIEIKKISLHDFVFWKEIFDY